MRQQRAARRDQRLGDRPQVVRAVEAEALPIRAEFAAAQQARVEAAAHFPPCGGPRGGLHDGEGQQPIRVARAHSIR